MTLGFISFDVKHKLVYTKKLLSYYRRLEIDTTKL